MSIVREILDCLGRSSLVRLAYARNLGARSSNDERRSSLAKSYRGDVTALVDDLQRQELVHVFASITFFINGEEKFLPAASRYRDDEIRRLARKALVEEVAAPEFERCDDDSDEEHASEEDASDGDDGDDDEREEDKAEHDVASEARNPFPRIGREWTRPRKITGIMRRLGWGATYRLSRRRFVEVLEELERRGFQASYDDYTPVTTDDDSPGVYSKLRLRRIGPSPTVAKKDASNEDDRPIDEQDAGPPIVLHPSEPPASRRQARPPDYDLAVHRLYLLTAVPSLNRQRSADWPWGYLTVATRGLSLRRAESELLERIAVSLSMGTHSPIQVIEQLLPHLSRDEWRELLGEFRRLNSDSGAVVDSIITHVQQALDDLAIRSSEATVRDPVPPDFADSRQYESERRAPMAASSTTRESTAVEKNQRSLGALHDMFDD